MKTLIVLFAALFSTAYAGTCTSISRSNFSPNTVIQSSAMNSQLNTVYNHVNDLDGGCIDDGTLEAAALNSTEFAPLLKSIRQGCRVTESDNNTLSVSKCLLSVNNVLVSTSTATTVAFGCSGCASDTVNTTYYLYALTTSTTSALALRISTTVPNEDGFDNSGNRVMARFYNNSLSNIDGDSITHWVEHGWQYVVSDWTTFTLTPGGETSAPTKGTASKDFAQYRRIGGSIETCYSYVQTGAGSAGSGNYLFPIGGEAEMDTGTRAHISNYNMMGNTGVISSSATFTSNNRDIYLVPVQSSRLRMLIYDPTATTSQVFNSGGGTYNYGITNMQLSYCASFPVSGW